eukprot:12233931-Prorocentrum_lima.AAC.1
MDGCLPASRPRVSFASAGDSLGFVSYNVTSLCCSHPLASPRLQVLANAFAKHGVHIAAIQEGRWRST